MNNGEQFARYPSLRDRVVLTVDEPTVLSAAAAAGHALVRRLG